MSAMAHLSTPRTGPVASAMSCHGAGVIRLVGVRNAGGEPSLIRGISDQQRGVVARCRGRREQVVDHEVAVRASSTAPVWCSLNVVAVTAHNSEANTLAPTVVPMLLLPAMSRPRPLT